MKKAYEKVRPLIIVLLSVFVTLAMNMNMDKNTAIEYSFTGNSILCVIFFVLTYWLLSKISQVKNRRLKICCTILAVLFASFEVVGQSIDTYLDLSGILESSITLTKSIIKWFGYAILIYGVIANIYLLLDKKEFFKGECKWFTNNKRTFFITWGIIFLAWVPYFLNYYPGVITADSMGQICQSLGIYNLTNHHPVFHTFFISIAMNIGKLLGNYNIGVAIYSVVQMIVTSCIFSFAIYYMAKRNVDIKFRILTLLFYAFYPVNALYSITMWKDIPFAVAMLIFTIMMTEIAVNREHFMKSKLKNVLLVISMLLVILFRNNGLYVVVLTLPFIFIFARQNYKKLIVITAIVLVFYGIWKGPIFALFDIDEGSTKEALSIPLQQFARMTKYENLTDDERWRIYKYLPVDNLADYYYPKISDQVKNNFDDEAFVEDKIGFVKLWVKLCLKYPRSAIEAFLCNSYGYYYPEAVHWVVGREVFETTQEQEKALDLKATPIVDMPALEKFDAMLDNRNLPLNSMLYSIGFTFWIVVTMLMYAIYKKEYRLMLIYIPVGILWLTCLASPVFGEFRYIYSMFTCLPIMLGVHFREKKKEESEVDADGNDQNIRGTIKVENVSTEKNILKIDYTVTKGLEKFFNVENKFRIEYSEDIENTPKSIAIIPFVSNVLPIIWLTNSNLEIEELDKNYYDSIQNTKKAFKQMYPKVKWRGNIKVNKLIENKVENKVERKSLFFSGGVDSTSSLITVRNEKPILITIWGSDIWEHDEQGWQEAKSVVEKFGKQFNLENKYMKSNFRKFINEQELTKAFEFKLKDSWWHGVQHGIGLIGHVAPYAYKYNIVTHYIPATYTKEDKNVTCASYPSIDESVKFVNCSIIHEGFNKTRQQKIENICNYVKKTGEKISLRVCYMERGKKLNCCNCEKCYRTIMAIIAEKQDPNNYGFEVNKEKIKEIETKLKNDNLITKSTKKMWKEIEEKFKENKEFWKSYKELNWIIK